MSKLVIIPRMMGKSSYIKMQMEIGNKMLNQRQELFLSWIKSKIEQGTLSRVNIDGKE